MNLQAGLDLFDETGSLVARPARIVPVLFVPAVVLWVPRVPDPPEAWPDFSWTVYSGIERSPVPERIEGSRITFTESMLPPDVQAVHDRMERYMTIAQEYFFGAPRPSVPQLHEHTPADDDLVATLLDFARAGDESGFRELAVMRGVPAAEIGTMWDGTLKRLGRLAS